MNCRVCGQRLESYSIITGVGRPCGHCQIDEKTAKKNARMFRGLNREVSKIVRGQ